MLPGNAYYDKNGKFLGYYEWKQGRVIKKVFKFLASFTHLREKQIYKYGHFSTSNNHG
jgi:hypothetical protein